MSLERELPPPPPDQTEEISEGSRLSGIKWFPKEQSPKMKATELPPEKKLPTKEKEGLRVQPVIWIVDAESGPREEFIPEDQRGVGFEQFKDAEQLLKRLHGVVETRKDARIPSRQDNLPIIFVGEKVGTEDKEQERITGGSDLIEKIISICKGNNSEVPRMVALVAKEIDEQGLRRPGVDSLIQAGAAMVVERNPEAIRRYVERNVR
jgi:hypothetical protein